jgi:hypothetical protein
MRIVRSYRKGGTRVKSYYRKSSSRWAGPQKTPKFRVSTRKAKGMSLSSFKTPKTRKSAGFSAPRRSKSYRMGGSKSYRTGGAGGGGLIIAAVMLIGMLIKGAVTLIQWALTQQAARQTARLEPVFEPVDIDGLRQQLQIEMDEAAHLDSLP